MSQQIDDGGSAFPFGQISELTGQPINGWFSPGMSLRDWFAGMALAGLLANPHVGGDVGAAARGAYMHADAMIAARKGGAE
jgi:hypothetical protein